jgi:hypothetical protein
MVGCFTKSIRPIAMRSRIARPDMRQSPPLTRRICRLIFVLAALTLQAFADDKLDVQPNPISISPGYSSVKALVILQTEKPVINPSLTWMSNDVQNVELVKLSQDKGKPGRVFVWNAKIDFLPSIRVPGTVLLHAEYSADKVPKHLVASLNLQSQADGTGKAIEASIEGNLDAVSQQRPGYAHLVVTNNLEVPVRMHVDVEQPRGIFQRLIVSDFDVPARSSGQQPIELRVEQQTTPGPYSLVFTLQATWQRAGYQEQRTLAISKTATAGVFFESELLKVLGIPSFLVLPGSLVLFTIQLMLMLGIFGLKNDSKLPQLTVTSPGFWILAISLSGIFAFAYIAISKTNYLLRYGAEDLRNVWLWSIAIGIAAYCVYALATLRWRRKHVYSAKDGPMDALRKMGSNGIKTVTPVLKFKIGNGEFTGNVIEKIEDGMASLWVAPKIFVDWVDEGRESEKKFQNAINTKLGPKEVAEILETAMKNKEAKGVQWSTSKTSVPYLYHMKTDTISNYSAPEQIFEIRS